MTFAFRTPEIPPAPFSKGGEELAAFSGESAGQPCKLRPAGPCKKEMPFLAICRLSFVPPPSKRAFFLPPLKKGGRGGFSGGFTLVEVIVTIMMAAIMGAFFIQYMGTAMSRSVVAIENVRDEADAEKLMEQIVADYVAEINKTDPTEALSTIKGKNYGPSVTMTYITFNSGGVEQALVPPNTSNTLKVMVRAPGNSLTTLLTQSRVSTTPPDPTLPPIEF